MKFFLSCVVYVLYAPVASGQAEPLTSSFAHHYSIANPALHYRYDSLEQVHDYSGNWDLDGDGRNDQVFFVGTGGAHLYYFLRVILSSDNKVRDYSFLQSDFPLLPAENEPALSPGEGQPLPLFAAGDMDGDGSKDIFMQLDESSFIANKKVLKKHGIRSRYILITFSHGRVQSRDYPADGKQPE